MAVPAEQFVSCNFVFLVNFKAITRFHLVADLMGKYMSISPQKQQMGSYQNADKQRAREGGREREIERVSCS